VIGVLARDAVVGDGVLAAFGDGRRGHEVFSFSHSSAYIGVKRGQG
jgi:hypothetical protein